MSKQLTIILGAVVVLSLIGAGCSQGTNEEKTNNNAASSTPLTMNTNSTTPLTEGIILTVEKNGAGRAKLTWQTTTPSKTGWRVMHSARTQSKTPFWQLVAGDKTGYELNGLTNGKRYFRVCAWTGSACGATSNEVELDVE